MSPRGADRTHTHTNTYVCVDIHQKPSFYEFLVFCFHTNKIEKKWLKNWDSFPRVECVCVCVTFHMLLMALVLVFFVWLVTLKRFCIFDSKRFPVRTRKSRLTFFVWFFVCTYFTSNWIDFRVSAFFLYLCLFQFRVKPISDSPHDLFGSTYVGIFFIGGCAKWYLFAGKLEHACVKSHIWATNKCSLRNVNNVSRILCGIFGTPNYVNCILTYFIVNFYKNYMTYSSKDDKLGLTQKINRFNLRVFF